MKALHRIVAAGLGLLSQLTMAAGVSGIVVDGNGAAVPDVQLVMTRSAPAPGARAITVF
jgi:hypothetical protein